MTNTVQVKTLPELAEELGLHRSTLVRLEQRGVIDKAPKVGKPIQGRVYDAALEAKVRKQLQAYFDARKIADAIDRPPPPEGVLLTTRGAMAVSTPPAHDRPLPGVKPARRVNHD